MGVAETQEGRVAGEEDCYWTGDVEGMSWACRNCGAVTESFEFKPNPDDPDNALQRCPECLIWDTPDKFDWDEDLGQDA